MREERGLCTGLHCYDAKVPMPEPASSFLRFNSFGVTGIVLLALAFRAALTVIIEMGPIVPGASSIKARQQHSHHCLCRISFYSGLHCYEPQWSGPTASYAQSKHNCRSQGFKRTVTPWLRPRTHASDRSA